MAIEMIRVRAKGDGCCPHVDADSRPSRRARWVGRDESGAVLAGGELVADIAFYRRRINQGALEIVAEPAMAPAPIEPIPTVVAASKKDDSK